MRKMKFRAWNNRKSKFSLNPSVYDYNSVGESSWFDLNAGLEDTDFIFMQFTGLKDKNGKEIYEGDIVNEKWGNTTIDGGEVWFSEQGMWLVGSKKEQIGECFMVPEKEYKIIGNIYENPELLTPPLIRGIRNI